MALVGETVKAANTATFGYILNW